MIGVASEERDGKGIVEAVGVEGGVAGGEVGEGEEEVGEGLSLAVNFSLEMIMRARGETERVLRGEEPFLDLEAALSTSSLRPRESGGGEAALRDDEREGEDGPGERKEADVEGEAEGGDGEARCCCGGGLCMGGVAISSGRKVSGGRLKALM